MRLFWLAVSEEMADNVFKRGRSRRVAGRGAGGARFTGGLADLRHLVIVKSPFDPAVFDHPNGQLDVIEFVFQASLGDVVPMS